MREPYIDFWSNGKVSAEGQYWEGKQVGTWHFYNQDGTLHAVITFKEGKEIDSLQYLYNDDGTIHEIIQFSDFSRTETS